MKSEWIDGTVEIENGACGGGSYTAVARKHRKSGHIEFELRKEFWCGVNEWWWPSFKPLKEESKIGFHFHKWVHPPNTLALGKRGVIGRRFCIKCGRSFIKKMWYRDFFGRLRWEETLSLDMEDVDAYLKLEELGI